jgi:protein TonB
MQESGSIARTIPVSDRSGGTRPARKDIVVLTCDDEFLLSIGPAMDDRYRSRPTDGTGAWTEALRGRGGVALIDAASLANAPEIVRTVEAGFPAFAIAVVTPAAARAQWSPALSRGTIACLLDREALTHEAVAAALEIEPRAATTPPPVRGSNPPGDRTPGGNRTFLIGGAALVALAIAGAAWMWLGGKDAAPAPRSAGAVQAPPADEAARPAVPTEAAPPVAAPVDTDLSVPEILSAARVAFGERRYLEPAGNNALELYSRALGLEAGNAEAADGVRRVVAVAVAQAQGEIKAGEIDDAARLFDTLRVAAPEDASVVTLGKDLAAARPRWLAARAREAIAGDQYAVAERLIGELATLGTDKAAVLELRRGLDARRKDTDLARAVGDARAALDQDSLLDTTANGPRAKLAALQQIDRRNAQVVAFQRDYQTALIRAAREATRTGEFASAERLLAAATDIGGAREAADARRDLQSARDAAAAREQQRAEASKQRVEKETTRAAAVAPPPRMPKAKRRTAPQYPADAERNGIEGAVTVEFALTADGRTRDIRVVESTPPGVFDQAAIVAVRNWRFEAVSAEDAARLPRSSVRLAFQLGDKR